MKKISLPIELRKCPDCGERNGLSYYCEGNYCDEYYCEHCYKIALWNGKVVEGTDGEAYPNRDKFLTP